MKSDMENEEYVAIAFCKYKIDKGKVQWSTKQKPKIIEIPRWLYDSEHTKNRISWILSRFRYFDRKHYYDTNYQFFDKKTGIDVGMLSAYSKAKYIKMNLTKYENKLKKYEQDWQPTLLLQDIQKDEAYQKARKTIENQKCELRNAEENLKEEREKLQEQTAGRKDLYNT